MSKISIKNLDLYLSLIHISREEGSGTRGAFTELFGVVDEEDNDMTTLDAQVTNSTSVMMTTVSENEYAIGYISLGSLDESLVKAVKIDGAEATAENIENGSYKVSRPFNVAVKPDSTNEVAKAFMAFIMSTEEMCIRDRYLSAVFHGQQRRAADP